MTKRQLWLNLFHTNDVALATAVTLCEEYAAAGKQLNTEKLAEEIEKLEPVMQALKDEDFKDKTLEFKAMLEDGKTLDDIVVPAFALAREAAYRAIGEKPFHVQILGGLAIHYGNIAEMKTGEGKTLTTILPAYLNALSGQGVHVVTTNEYLSSRNAEWMRPIYDLLGVSVGINLRELSPKEKQEAYNADITYSTNNEVGFDYLRDNMVVRKEDRVQRGLNFCIIDEVDSILIDEARTPLIISGGQFNTNSLYIEADRVAKRLKEHKHLIIICGHYEGFDERIKTRVDEVISIGDYILTGGEIPAMAITDSVARLLPGVITKASLDDESFNDNLLDYPTYTKPAEYRGLKVPDVLVSGNHKLINEYRKNMKIEKTKALRPDLMENKND